MGGGDRLVAYGIQGFGWYVRRSKDSPANVIPFYQAALGLRQLRPPGPGGVIMLWTGDIGMFEINVLVPTAESVARKDDITLVMRARNYERAKAMMLAAGAKLASEDSASRTAYFIDPFGFTTGVREANDASAWPHDRAAAATWRAGGVSIPGTPALPPELQDIAAIVVKVVDPVAMAAFYSDLFGFEMLDKPSAKGAMLAFGRTVVLELKPGGRLQGIPPDRNQVPDTWIVRLYDHDAFAERAKQKSVRVVNVISLAGGKLTYAVDPEGHLFGFEQRTPDLLAEGGKERVEDARARRLWAEADR